MLYSVAFQQFGAYVASLGLTDDVHHFDDQRVLGFMHWMHAHRAGPNTINARLSALQTLANYGMKYVKDGKGQPRVKSDPVVGLERPRKRKPAEKFLLPDELRAFLEVHRPLRDNVVRAMLVDTGLRRAELCAANFGDLLTVGEQTNLQVVVK